MYTFFDLAQLRRHWNSHFTKNGRIKAWMFVPTDIVDDLLTGTTTECASCYADMEDRVEIAYEWMKDCMDRAAIPGRKADITPWWCWVNVGDGYDRPTTNHSWPNTTLLELSLYPEQVLLSEFQCWHVALNYWLNTTNEESMQFNALLHKQGLDIYGDVPLPEPYHSYVQSSWYDVFRLDCNNDFVGDEPVDQRAIQGTFWTLTPDMIVGIAQPIEVPDYE